MSNERPDIEAIRAKYHERQRLLARETEIRTLPAEDITPELDAEALDCWMELERVTWSDEAIGNMLAHIDALEAKLAVAMQYVPGSDDEPEDWEL